MRGGSAFERSEQPTELARAVLAAAMGWNEGDIGIAHPLHGTDWLGVNAC